MWCSSFGASSDLPSTMELNVFINTFELITDERHTLAMAHLTGGETIAFEMVQSDHVSELSGFLLGDAGKALKQGKVAPVAALGASDHGRALGGGAGGAPGCCLSLEQQVRLASELKEQTAQDQERRSKLAEELIAEEEEEHRRKEKKKAKKKGKKDKQKEKRKEKLKKGEDGCDEEEDDDKEEEEADERDAAQPVCSACCDSTAASAASSHSSHGSPRHDKGGANAAANAAPAAS